MIVLVMVFSQLAYKNTAKNVRTFVQEVSIINLCSFHRLEEYHEL